MDKVWLDSTQDALHSALFPRFPCSDLAGCRVGSCPGNIGDPCAQPRAPQWAAAGSGGPPAAAGGVEGSGVLQDRAGAGDPRGRKTRRWGLMGRGLQPRDRVPTHGRPSARSPRESRGPGRTGQGAAARTPPHPRPPLRPVPRPLRESRTTVPPVHPQCCRGGPRSPLPAHPQRPVIPRRHGSPAALDPAAAPGSQSPRTPTSDWPLANPRRQSAYSPGGARLGCGRPAPAGRIGS